MTDRYAIAVAQTPSLSKAARSYALSQGQPSPTEETYRRRALVRFQGHWRAGSATDAETFGQSAFICEVDGIFGSPVATDDWSWDGGAGELTASSGSFVDSEWTTSWAIWVTTTDGGWTRGLYLVDSAAGDVLTISGGPAGSVAPTGYLLQGVYAEKYVPLGAPMSSDNNSPAPNVSSIVQSPWHDYGVLVPAGALTNGGVLTARFYGRLRARRLKGRPYREVGGSGVYDTTDGCDLLFTVDPWSSALANHGNASPASLGPSESKPNEVQFFPATPTRVGWAPETKYGAVTFERGVPYLYANSTTATGTNQISNAGTPFTASFPALNALMTVTDAGTSGLALATDYYVRSRPSATTITVSLTPGGSTVALSNSTTDVDVQFETMRLVSSAHLHYDGEAVHITTFDTSNPNNDGLSAPSTLLEGQTYYVAGRTAGKFHLALDRNDTIRVGYVNDGATDLIVSRPVRGGSRHAMTWAFHLKPTEVVGATATAADDRLTSTAFDETHPRIGAEIRVTDAGMSGLSEEVAYFVLDRPTATSCTLKLVTPDSTVTLSDGTVDLDFDEFEDYSLFELELVGFADGRTASDEQGVSWSCRMRVFPPAERVGSTDRRVLAHIDGERVWSAGISRTTPGSSMSRVMEPGPATAAPLFFVKRYFTAPDAVTFTGATAVDGGGGGSIGDVFTHDSFVGLKVNDQVVVTGIGTIPTPTQFSTGTYYVVAKPNASNPESVRLSLTVGGAPITSITATHVDQISGTFTPTYGAFTSAFWDWGGAYDVVYLAEQLLTETVSVNGYDEYPITPTFQGNEVIGYTQNARNSTAYRAATVTEVVRGGNVIGEVAYHDNLRRVMFVRWYDPAVRIRYGDALTLNTYRYERSGNTWSWASSAVQSKACTARVVRVAPQATRLSARIAVTGPPTTDVEFNVRGGYVEVGTVESR